MSIDDNEPVAKSGGLTKHLGEALDRFSENGPSFLGGFFATRISLTYLKKWLHRIGSGLRAGIDIRTLLNQEAHNGPLSYRPIFAEFHRRLSKGDSLADAARDAGEFFPAMVVEMIHVGEFTGKLDEVLLRLADHYGHLITLRRTFMIGIAWPAIQLVMAIGVIGLLIFVLGMIGNGNPGESGADLLGFGLYGTAGLIKYLCFVFGVFALIAAAVMAVRRGWLGPAGWLLVMKIPLLGQCIQNMALARLTWTLSLTLESGADARQAMRMALRSSQLALYTDVTERTDAQILKGVEFHEALRKMDVFPDEFLHALEAAEISGRLSESMILLSKDYSERATTSSRVLTGVATFMVYAGVAALLIYLIFRMALSYVRLIESFL